MDFNENLNNGITVNNRRMHTALSGHEVLQFFENIQKLPQQTTDVKNSKDSTG